MLSVRRLVGDIEKHKSILVCIFRRQLKNSVSSAINNCQYDYKLFYSEKQTPKKQKNPALFFSTLTSVSKLFAGQRRPCDVC